MIRTEILRPVKYFRTETIANIIPEGSSLCLYHKAAQNPILIMKVPT